MTAGYDVLLLGGYFCDLIFNGLPELPALGKDLFGTDFDLVAGGNFRTCKAFKRLGVRAGWLTDFGDDFFSRLVLEMAAAEGLEAGLFRYHPAPLRHVSASFSYAHDRGFISYADPPPAPLPVTATLHAQRPHVLLISHLEYGAEQAEWAAAAHAAGAIVYMDCQSQPAQVTLALPGVREALRRVDVFAPNESEALHLTGAATIEAALETLAALAPTVVIKRGGQGALARRGGETVEAPALPVTVRDTTGAGDCFNAGFLYGYLQGYDLDRCLRAGNICGGLAAASRDKETLPAAAQMEHWLQAG